MQLHHRWFGHSFGKSHSQAEMRIRLQRSGNKLFFPPRHDQTAKLQSCINQGSFLDHVQLSAEIQTTLHYFFQIRLAVVLLKTSKQTLTCKISGFVL